MSEPQDDTNAPGNAVHSPGGSSVSAESPEIQSHDKADEDTIMEESAPVTEAGETSASSPAKARQQQGKQHKSQPADAEKPDSDTEQDLVIDISPTKGSERDTGKSTPGKRGNEDPKLREKGNSEGQGSSPTAGGKGPKGGVETPNPDKEDSLHDDDDDDHDDDDDDDDDKNSVAAASDDGVEVISDPEDGEDTRLLQEPVDREVEARKLDLTAVKDGEKQNRVGGRTVKRPDAYSPDHDDYTRKRKKFSAGRGRRKRSHSYQSGASVSGGKVSKRQKIDPKWILPFAEGWRREIVLRNTYDEIKVGKGRPADVYYYPPNGGPKRRSCVEINKYLQKIGNTTLSMDCFTFVKETIHEEPSEFVRSAGRHSFGRLPGSKSSDSPSKSPKTPKTPKTPVMKQKRSPFLKSPLSLKKTAISLASSPTSPKTSPLILKMGNKQLPSQKSGSEDKTTKFMVVRKLSETSSPNLTTATKIKPLSVDGALTSTESPQSGFRVIKIAPKVIDAKKPVAKKHTGKRSMTSGQDKPSIKKMRVEDNFLGEGQRLCGMDCPGRHGIPPSLHCTICMCMFHPECVGRASHQRLEGFVCKSCLSVTQGIVNNNKEPAVTKNKLQVIPPGPPPPPPLQAPGSVLFKPSIRYSGPPPLRAAPNISGAVLRVAPPPLRMAPMAGTSVGGSIMAPPPLRVANSDINIRPAPTTTVINRAIPPPVITPLPVSTLPNSNGSAPALSQVQILPSGSGIRSVVPVSTPPPPINIRLPSTTPKEVSGQILALPSNVTSRLDLDKPVSLKVNGQNYIIPPHCFINTHEGAKIYLPPGYLPSNVTQGPTNPLNINLNANPNKDGQTLNITPLSEAAKSKTSNAKTPSPSIETVSSASSSQSTPRASPVQKKKITSVCPIQQLHLGFDCMLCIFSYLGVKELLCAQKVCRTWRRVASQHCLWKHVQFRGCNVSDWEKAALALRKMHTQSLDMRGLLHNKDTNRTWHQFTAALSTLTYLQRVDFGQCPSTVLHAVADKLTDMSELTAEFITDSSQDSQMWSTNTKLDIGKFSKLKQLSVLKLRGVYGLTLPSFSFCGYLKELGSLTHMRMLSLTTLHDVSEDEFTFLSSLTSLEELELGDLSSWKAETYSHLSSLTKLRSLRLECGLDYKEGGLGEALKNLTKLKSLELIKFAVSTSLVNTLPKLSTIETLSIWPDTEHRAAHVNTCTLRAISEMNGLRQLDWGIMIDSTAENSFNCTETLTSETSRKDCIPVLPANFDLFDTEKCDTDLELVLEYLSISQLVDRLCTHLPDTKIRVFKVPIISPKPSSSKTASSP